MGTLQPWLGHSFKRVIAYTSEWHEQYVERLQLDHHNRWRRYGHSPANTGSSAYVAFTPTTGNGIKK